MTKRANLSIAANLSVSTKLSRRENTIQIQKLYVLKQVSVSIGTHFCLSLHLHSKATSLVTFIVVIIISKINNNNRTEHARSFCKQL